MQIEEILNYAFPYTDEDLTDTEKHLQKTYKRERLQRMIDSYKNGDIVNFDVLNISVDMEEILKRVNRKRRNN